MNTSVMKCFHNFQTYDRSLIEYFVIGVFCYVVQEIWMVHVLEGNSQQKLLRSLVDRFIFLKVDKLLKLSMG
jgi:hypothetical protein